MLQYLCIKPKGYLVNNNNLKYAWNATENLGREYKK